jgi:hypothetical protein
MVNVRPDARWPGFVPGLLEDSAGLLLGADASRRGGLLGDFGSSLLGYSPTTRAAVPAPSLHDATREVLERLARLYPDGNGGPFGFVDRQGLVIRPIVPVAGRSPPVDTRAHDRNPARPPSTVPFALTPSSQAASGPPFFAGAGRVGIPLGAMLPPSFPGQTVPAERLHPSLPARQRPPTSFDGPIPGKDLWRASIGATGPEATDAWSASDAPQPVSDHAADPSIVRVSDREPAPADEEAQIAQQQGAPRRPPGQTPQRPQAGQAQSSPMRVPGRGYGHIPQVEIERGMTPLQKKINRDQAFRELTRQPLTAEEARSALPDNWESTKPADLVDEIKRAAERHGVPIQMFARLLYQEGKFNERDKLRKSLPMDSKVGSEPIGYARMTNDTLKTLKNLAHLRGDTKRSEELAAYSLSNREQSFDAAAEQLAYLYRLTGGSWPKAVAAYNVGPGLANWFNGASMDPQLFAAHEDKKSGKLILSKKWTDEIPAYLRFIFRGATEDPAIGGMYDYQPPEQYRARDWINRLPMPDTKHNP